MNITIQDREILQKFEYGVMSHEDGEFILLGEVILRVHEDDHGTPESLLSFQTDVREMVANMVVIVPTTFTELDLDKFI